MFTSFFGVVAISVDRFLAIYLHLRYQELVTRKFPVAVVTSIWLFSVLLSLISLLISRYIKNLAFISILGVCFIFITVVYWRIYLAVNRHTKQMQALQVTQGIWNEERTHFARLTKSAIGTFYVYVVFLLCYCQNFVFLFLEL